jgi:hypothetical protein
MKVDRYTGFKVESDSGILVANLRSRTWQQDFRARISDAWFPIPESRTAGEYEPLVIARGSDAIRALKNKT